MVKRIVKVVAILLAPPLALVGCLAGGVFVYGLLEGPTICELVVDNRGTSPLLEGSIHLNSSRKAERKIGKVEPHTRVTFDFGEFYTEPGGELTFTRADSSEVKGEFGYIDGGDTWRYTMVVTDDSSSFNGEMIRRQELRARP